MTISRTTGLDATKSVRRLSIFIVHPSHFLTDYQANGDGLIANGFIRELARRGHELDVACEWTNFKEPLPPNVTLHYMRCRINTEPLHRVEYLVRARLLLRRLRRTRRLDIAHQLNPVFAGLSLGLAGARIPVVLGTFVARWPNEDRERGFLANVRERVLDAVSHLQQRGARAMLVTTRLAMEQRISADPRVRARVRFLKHGVDTNQFLPRDEAVAAPFGRILLVAGLLPRKGVLVLLEAFALVYARFPAARLTFAGGGGETERLRRRSVELGIGDAVELLGDLPRSQIPALMRDSDIYCLPSYGEPYATSIIEAMSAGLAIVVSDSGGVPEMVDDAGALKVATGSRDALATALASLIAEPERARVMGRHNRERAVREFDWRVVGDALERVYDEVLGAAHARAPRR